MSVVRWILKTIGQVTVLSAAWFALYYYFDVYVQLSPENKDDAPWMALIGVILIVAAWGVFLAMLKAIGNAVRGDKE